MAQHPPDIAPLVEHLFRREAGKIVSVLVRHFGIAQLKSAEDAVQDALLEATQIWPYRGVPDNPPAWLFRVAKNKLINALKRGRLGQNLAERLVGPDDEGDHWNFSEPEMLDDTVRMLFACCHPAISADSQVALALKTLCGFGIPEIARAFLSNEENINKRLVRARQKLRAAKISLELPGGAELEARLDAVLEIIYLLFNEGYSASKGEDLIRFELCGEALRLAGILENSPILPEKSKIHALLALMQLNAARFPARLDEAGNALTLAEQNRSLWRRDLIAQGIASLEKSMSDSGAGPSAYHILAAVSACHCLAAEFSVTDWPAILDLYDSLAELDPSPLVLLNRAVAVAQVHGPETALRALESIGKEAVIHSYPLYPATRASLLEDLRRFKEAASEYERALALSASPAERAALQKRLSACREK